MPTPRNPRTEITGISGAVVKAMSRRMLGSVPESLGVMWHHRPVMRFFVGLGRRPRSWDACDQSLKSFAHMAVASHVGCGACLDYGYFAANDEGLDIDKARQVPRWRDSDVFTALERDVMTYAEAMTHTPPTVTDDMSERLRAQIGTPALVELTAFIGLANLFARTNVALGLESEGLAASCGLPPLAEPTSGAVVTGVASVS